MVIPELVEKLSTEHDLNDAKLKTLLETDSMDEALFFTADKKRREIYGDEVYIRGLIEFSNYCKNNCYYCGIRRDNAHAGRYRLSKEEILACCAEGYLLGFRTFVLQGGEDPCYPDGLESIPRRYAIVRTNKIMVDTCDWLVCYVRHGASNSRNLLEYTKRRVNKGLIQIKNIYESEEDNR